MSKSLSWSVFATTAGLVTGASPVQAQEGFKIENNDSIYIDAQAFKVMPGKAKGDAATQIKSLGARELGQGTIVFRSGEKLYIVEPGTAIVQNARAMPDSTDTRRFVPRDPPYMRFQSSGTGDGSMSYMRDPAYAQRRAPGWEDPSYMRFQSPGPAGDGSMAYMRDPAYGLCRDVLINNPNWEPPSYMRDPAYAQRRAPGWEDPSYMRFQSPGPAGDGSMAYMRDPAYGPRRDVYINNPNWEPPSYMRDPAYAQRADVYINNPDFVQYWLKKSFDENWTASDAR